MLPWLQRRLSPATTASFYSDFYDKHWHNALTILTIFISNGLFWLVLFLWAELFKLIGIQFLIAFSSSLTGLFQWRLAWFLPVSPCWRVCRCA